MKFRFTRKLTLGLATAATLFSLTVSHALAWNGTGHMTVAEIAYDNLTPATKASVDALLLRHKDYGRWMSLCPAGYTDRARFAFLKAATWPDDIRKTADDRPLWHFTDEPVIAPGYTADPISLLPVKPNADSQLPIETTLLTDKKATDGDRAIALCWVEHLVGDVHQPLHDASLFSAAFPKGDRGGNSESLPASSVAGDAVLSDAHPRRLHALWDDLLGRTQDPLQIRTIATGLETTAYSRVTFPQIKTHPTVHDWVLEGSALAKQYGYWNGALAMTPVSVTRTDVALPAGYLTAAHQVGNRQIALAGLRLADTLNAQTFPGVTAPPMPADAVPSAPAAAPGSPDGTAPTPTNAAAAVPGTVDSGGGTSPEDGQIVGNKRTHIYHMPGEGRLPAVKNRVYFKTEDEAKAAGYHKAGS